MPDGRFKSCMTSCPFTFHCLGTLTGFVLGSDVGQGRAAARVCVCVCDGPGTGTGTDHLLKAGTNLKISEHMKDYSHGEVIPHVSPYELDSIVQCL